MRMPSGSPRYSLARRHIARRSLQSLCFNLDTKIAFNFYANELIIYC